MELLFVCFELWALVAIGIIGFFAVALFLLIIFAPIWIPIWLLVKIIFA